MKIGGFEGVYKTYKTEKIEKKESAAVKDGIKKTDVPDIKDKVDISGEAKIDSRKLEVDFLKRKLSSSGEVREDKVAEIKAQIQKGTYHVDLDKVAQAILDKVI